MFKKKIGVRSRYKEGVNKFSTLMNIFSRIEVGRKMNEERLLNKQENINQMKDGNQKITKEMASYQEEMQKKKKKKRC